MDNNNIVLESDGFLTVLVLINMFLTLNASHPFRKMHAKGNISTKVFTKWITCITHQVCERVASSSEFFSSPSDDLGTGNPGLGWSDIQKEEEDILIRLL